MSAYSINELYEVAPDVGPTTSTRPNPLMDEGALDEAEFVEMRLSPQRSRAGVIFDIRWCDFPNSNVALVVLTGLGKVAWSNDGNNRRHKWYSTRGYWTPTTSEFHPPTTPNSEDKWARDVGAPDASAHPATTRATTKISEYVLGFDWLSVSGLVARIYIGHTDGLDSTPPDMTELSDTEILAGFPQWSSIMDVHEYYTYFV